MICVRATGGGGGGWDGGGEGRREGERGVERDREKSSESPQPALNNEVDLAKEKWGRGEGRVQRRFRPGLGIPLLDLEVHPGVCN